MVGLWTATGGEKEQSNDAHTHCAADSTTTHTNPKLLSTTIRASKRKGAAAQPDGRSLLEDVQNNPGPGFGQEQQQQAAHQTDFER